MKKTSVRATAPGKLILIGEYAVLEGAPALVAATNHRAVVSCRPQPAGPSVSAPEIGIADLPFRIDAAGKVVMENGTSQETAHLLRFFTAAIEEGLAQEWLPSPEALACNFHLDTSQFFLKRQGSKLGLGSSAALTVSLSAALIALAGEKDFRDAEVREDLFAKALSCHRRAQGNLGSGIDVAASTFGGMLRFQPPGDRSSTLPWIEEIELPAGLFLLVVYSGWPASTRKLVEQVRRYQARDSQGYRRIIDEMSEQAFDAAHLLMGQEVGDFLDLIPAYCRAMQRLGDASDAPIVSEEHLKLRAIAEECGAAYKPSGAGGGDLGIAFAASEQCLRETGERMEAQGFELIEVELGGEGVMVQTEGAL